MRKMKKKKVVCGTLWDVLQYAASNNLPAVAVEKAGRWWRARRLGYYVSWHSRYCGDVQRRVWPLTRLKWSRIAPQVYIPAEVAEGIDWQPEGGKS